MAATEQLADDVGISQACRVLDIRRASFYRKKRPRKMAGSDPSPRRSPRRLKQRERDDARRTLYSNEFRDQTPRQVYVRLIDCGNYLCSVRTMYRNIEVRSVLYDSFWRT